MIDLTELKTAVDGRFYDIPMEDGSVQQGMSVTTVLDFVKVKSFLEEWQWDMQRELGMDGLKRYMDKKAWEGTQVHDMAEEYLRRVCEGECMYGDKDETILKRLKAGEVTPFEWTDDINKWIWKKFMQWVDWYYYRRPKVIWTEKKLYSREILVGGRADALLEVEATDKCPGGRGMFDYKTSADAQEKHLMQLAAYINMHEEMTGEQLDFGSVVVVGAKTKIGWKEVSICRDKVHKGSGMNEIDHYWEGFKRSKSMVEWALSDLKPNHFEYPRFVVPKAF